MLCLVNMYASTHNSALEIINVIVMVSLLIIS